MTITELKSTTQKSYYGKAQVILDDNGNLQLKSYNTIVCYIDRYNNFHKTWNGYSNTTAKHINDFRKLNGLEPINKKVWDSLPCKNTEKYNIAFSNGFITWHPNTTFDNYDDACEYADKVCEKRSSLWYSIV